MDLLQVQVEPPRADDHLTELECRGCLRQEDSARKPRHDLLRKPQAPVRLTFRLLSHHFRKHRRCALRFALWLGASE